jgi:hypothetical protein
VVDTPSPKRDGGGCAVSALRAHVVSDPPGAEQAVVRYYQLSSWNWGTLTPLNPSLRDARMPACGREGGGSVVAQRSAVMAETW